MSTWNYRVLARTHELSDEVDYSIHEVYYDDDGKPEKYSVEPAPVHSDNVHGIKIVMSMMMVGVLKPVLCYGEKFPEEFKPPVTDSSEVIYAPFTDEQVKNLNEYQNLGFVHEFTCGNNHKEDRKLIATNDGWKCPTCDYTSNWCHLYMTDVQRIKENWNNSPLGKVSPIKL